MVRILAKFIKDMLTGIDGESYDIGRILWAIAFIVGVVLECYSVVFGKPFDMNSYGIGVGSLLLAGGASVRIKSPTEPGQGAPTSGV